MISIAYFLTTYDLVSHGASGQECYGTYSETTQTGYGPGYVNSCIHSGSNEHSGGDTVWYNYALASAGTITNKDASDTTGNIITATESICPSGWSLPTTKQIDSNRTSSTFNPVLGGSYYSGTPHNEATRGLWWGSEAYNGATRYYLAYNGSLYTSYGSRRDGSYIRCVSEEKTVLDLTYMQDMTPAISNATPEGTTAIYLPVSQFQIPSKKDGSFDGSSSAESSMVTVEELSSVEAFS